MPTKRRSANGRRSSRGYSSQRRDGWAGHGTAEFVGYGFRNEYARLFNRATPTYLDRGLRMKTYVFFLPRRMSLTVITGHARSRRDDGRYRLGARGRVKNVLNADGVGRKPTVNRTRTRCPGRRGDRSLLLRRRTAYSDETCHGDDSRFRAERAA